jgi:hypothetical protein
MMMMITEIRCRIYILPHSFMTRTTGAIGQQILGNIWYTVRSTSSVAMSRNRAFIIVRH